MRTRLGATALLIAALVAAALLAACGGGDAESSSESATESAVAVSGDTDAQQVLDSALGSDGEPIQSGVLDLAFELGSSGDGAVSASATVGGPFESNGDGVLPSIDFTVDAGADAGGPTLGFAGAVTLTPDGLWVDYNDTDYVVDDPTFALIEDSYQQSADLQAEQGDSGSLSQLGIDPSTWLTEVSNLGEEDLDGAPVVHIGGTADVAQIIGDLGAAAEQTGQASQLDPNALGQLQDSVEDASIDVFANTADGSLRQLDVSLDVKNPTGAGGTDQVAVSIGIADPNTDQEITPPEDAQPISELLGELPGGISSLGGLAPGATSPTAPGAAGPDDAYFQCVAEAENIEDCADLLNAG